MIHLQPTIDRIMALLAEDTDASVTYAALEARLALERVCYDRLRQRHDYISHEQLKYIRRWQPGAVVTTLMEQVDPHVADTLTMQIGKSPAGSGVKPEDDEYVDLGTQIGFNSKRVAKQWQALARLALHAKLPEDRNDQIPEYGNREQIRAKVAEVIAELERIAEGTMAFSGIPIGGDVSFECQSCRAKNVRRAGLLREGESVFCINPDCKESWTAEKHEGGFRFARQTNTIKCQGCGQVERFPTRLFLDMRHDQKMTAACEKCDHENYVMWRLMQMVPAQPQGDEDGGGS